MSPIHVRLHPYCSQFRCAAALGAIFFPLLLSPPPALLAATPKKKSAKAETKKPDEPKEVLVFKNGDQITGKLLNSTGTKIKFDSEVAGKITVPLEKIKDLKSDRPFAIVLEEPKGFKKRGPAVEGIIELGAKGIIVVPVTPQKAKEVTSTTAPAESATSNPTTMVKTAPPVTVETRQAIPADRIGYVVDDSTYHREITRKINWMTG